MKLFTRSLVALALLAASLAPSLAANITILVGDNYYRGPGNTSLNFDVRNVAAGDVVTFSYSTGQSSHPTVSDNGAFATFQMNASNRTFTFPANFFTTVGAVFPYHCAAHGAPLVGQYGRITVVRPTATVDPRLAAALLNVYPNPSRGQVTVQINQKAGADYKLRLNNIIGQEIRTVALKPELTAAGLPLDLGNLPLGVYFYTLLVDGKAITTKRLVLLN